MRLLGVPQQPPYLLDIIVVGLGKPGLADVVLQAAACLVKRSCAGL
jgi:hypothetical protein